MAFFDLTRADGHKVTLNTETILELIDVETEKRRVGTEFENKAFKPDGSRVVDLPPPGGETLGEAFQKTRDQWAALDDTHTVVVHVNGARLAVTETREQVRELANTAISDMLSARAKIDQAYRRLTTIRQQTSTPDGPS